MKILFFSPFSGIWEHSIPEFQLAKNFAAASHEVVYASCGGCLEYCQVLECRTPGHVVPEKSSDEYCGSCTSLSNNYSTMLSVRRIEMSRCVSDAIATEFIGDSIKSYSGREIDLCIRGVPFGRMVMYDIILKFKKQNTILENEMERIYFNALLRNAVRSYIFCENHLWPEKFDRVIIYSPQYSTNHPVAEFFAKRGVPVYFIEAGTNLEKRLGSLRCWKWNASYLVNPLLAASEDILPKLRFDQQDLAWVTNHYLKLIDAKSHMVYSHAQSNSFEFYHRFPGASGKKVIMATMSSFDEAYAAFIAGLFPEKKACSGVFRNQIEWITQLINYVKSKPDWFLIVRVHPRDFPNKRESGLSDQGKLLSTAFAHIPPNVAINLPTDEISIYDLLGQIDLLTTGWSVTALEAGFLGIPVVTYDENMPSYPKSIMLTGSTIEEYWQNLESGLGIGWSFEQITESIKWLSLNHNYGALLISENFGKHSHKQSFYRKILRRLANLVGINIDALDALKEVEFRHDSFDLIRNMIETSKNNYLELPQIRSKIVSDISDTESESYKKAMNTLLGKLYGNNPRLLPPNFARIRAYVSR